MLVGKDNDISEEVYLEDFIVEKLIDKSNACKVFLMKNKKNGKHYAVKRLDKEIILRKNHIENVKNEKKILF